MSSQVIIGKTFRGFNNEAKIQFLKYIKHLGEDIEANGPLSSRNPFVR